MIFPNQIFAQQAVQSNKVITRVGNPSPSTTSSNKPSEGDRGFVYYCQKDSRWNDSCAYEWAICGPTSVAMIISTLGNKSGLNLNPKQVDLEFNKHNWRYCGDEPTLSMDSVLKSDWFKNMGFQAQPLAMPLNLNLANELLTNNYLILASVKPHIFVIDAVNPKEGTVHLRDPDKTCDPNGYWASSTTPWIYKGIPQVMIYAYAIKKIN